MFGWIKYTLRSFLNLIYPNLCSGCNNTLYEHEDTICLECLSLLDKHDITQYTKKFVGNIIPEQFVALSQFTKQSTIQELLHQLKYKNEPTIGVLLGKELAKHLNTSDIDFIIPVPMYYKKEKKRGYNQSFKIAKGIEKITKIEINNTLITKTKSTIPQARKSKKERHQIEAELFTVNNPEALINKHILLIDDVVTTGVTLETVINPLSKIKGIRISIGVIAYT